MQLTLMSSNPLCTDRLLGRENYKDFNKAPVFNAMQLYRQILVCRNTDFSYINILKS